MNSICKTAMPSEDNSGMRSIKKNDFNIWKWSYLYLEFYKTLYFYTYITLYYGFLS